MTPIYQDITNHCPAEGRYGNCVQASIASILDLPLSSVPHFSEGNDLPAPDGGYEESRRINRWLKNRGLVMVEIGFSADSLKDWQAVFDRTGAEFYHLMCGVSSRGFNHMTVGKNGRVIHDPHPEGGELLPYNGTYSIGFLTPASDHKPPIKE